MHFITISFKLTLNLRVLFLHIERAAEEEKDGRHLFRKESALQTLGLEKIYI